MAGRNIIFACLLLALVYGAAEAEDSNNSSESGNEIPQQCIDNSVTPVSCENENSPDALVPHPDDCELFYYCVSPDSAPICRQCPANLHFNPEKLVCDNPEDAGCEGSGSADGSGDSSGSGSGDSSGSGSGDSSGSGSGDGTGNGTV